MGELASSPNGCHIFQATQLSKGWAFKQHTDGVNNKEKKNNNNDDDDDAKNNNPWLPVKHIPSTVHQDLIDNKKIDHPFFGFNEIDAEWVGFKSWTYSVKFKAPPLPPPALRRAGTVAVLALDGLDTFARVSLDGTAILESDNMFVPHRVDISSLVWDQDDTNEDGGDHHMLTITFDSALLKAREVQRQHPDHKYIAWNGETARLAARKAQYHWGWDWGPILLTAGIWKPVRLEVYSARVSDVSINVQLSRDHQTATLSIATAVEGFYQRNNLRTEVSISLGDDDSRQAVITSGQAEVELDSEGKTTTTLTINQPRLWWPSGYGKQILYNVQIKLVQHVDHGNNKDDDNVAIHQETKRIGIRTVELVQQPDRHGTSFFFRINGVDIFCGGSCWIPADSFLTNVTKTRYRAWLELAVVANQKMIRVWGGGVYESDDFYDACDELGILVWQDFMFACGNYPVWPEMVKSIEAEAVANLRRIRHHPCLVILAGNNEDYQVQESSQLQYNWDDKNEDNWLKTDFPARYLYECLLPRVVKAEAAWIPYHPGSPWSGGGGKLSSDLSAGDLHQWNVWHGTQQKYQVFDELGGRFNSEFGMQAFPHIDTVRTFVQDENDDENELYPQSRAIDFHNKADGHERRIATYLVENVRTTTTTTTAAATATAATATAATATSTLEEYIYLTQLIQGEALMYAYRGWRKQWGHRHSHDRYCGGALVWQLNDCWPVTSWSIVDYYLRPKAAYYAIARTLAPIAVGVRRKHHDWSVSHARQPRTQAWELWAASGQLHDATADVELRFISVATGKAVKPALVKKGIRIVPNGTTNIATGYINNGNVSESKDPYVLAARLWLNGKIVSRDTDWPQPLKYLAFPERNLEVKQTSNATLLVSAQRPVKCVVFEEKTGFQLSDNAIDVLPGDDQVISVQALGQPPDRDNTSTGTSRTSSEPLNWKWTYLGANEQ